MIGLLCYFKLCASNALNDEYQLEIQGSHHPNPTAKGTRNPKVFFGVSYSGLEEF